MVLEEGRHEPEFREMGEGLVNESPQCSLVLIPPFIPLEVLNPTEPSKVTPLPIFACSFSLIPLELFLPPIAQCYVMRVKKKKQKKKREEEFAQDE